MNNEVTPKMNSLLRQRRAWLAVPLTLATIFTALLTWTLTTTSPAQAVANRRVCLYLSDTPGRTNVKVKNSGTYVTAASKRYVGVNYTKQKDCPKITNEKGKEKFRLRFGDYPRDDGRKSFCENWLSEIKATGKLYTSESDPAFNLPAGQNDVCTAMKKDIVYEFFVINYEGDLDIEPENGDFVVENNGSIWSYVQDM